MVKGSKFCVFKKNTYICNVMKKQRITKNYKIQLERKDRCTPCRYIRFECKVTDFYKALEAAETKIEKLKLQIDMKYEIIKIEKI